MGVSIYHDWRYKLIDERQRIKEVIRENGIEGEDEESKEQKAQNYSVT